MAGTIAPQLDSYEAWAGHKAHCIELIERFGAKNVCEIGGGRDPLLSVEEAARLGLTYTVLDVSASELALADPAYDKLCADICADDLSATGERFDFMFSKMVAEHVPSGEKMHRNVLSVLRPGGVAFHFFPTLYTPVFVANRILPQKLSRWFVERGAPRDAPKFPALYSKCVGPTPRMHRFYEELGYEVVEYRPFYGTSYFRRLPVVRGLDARFSAWAARRGTPYLTSFVYLVLRKPPS